MTIVAKYWYTYNSVPGGGSPFGSSVSFAPPTGPSPNDVTIAVVFSARNSTAQTFTPGSGWTVLDTRQQVLSRTPTVTPYSEAHAGTNPEYITITTLVAVGYAGTLGNTSWMVFDFVAGAVPTTNTYPPCQLPRAIGPASSWIAADLTVQTFPWLARIDQANQAGSDALLAALETP